MKCPFPVANPSQRFAQSAVRYFIFPPFSLSKQYFEVVKGWIKQVCGRRILTPFRWSTNSKEKWLQGRELRNKWLISSNWQLTLAKTEASGSLKNFSAPTWLSSRLSRSPALRWIACYGLFSTLTTYESQNTFYKLENQQTNLEKLIHGIFSITT